MGEQNGGGISHIVWILAALYWLFVLADILSFEYA